MSGASQFVGASHLFGYDLVVSASGDILTATGIPLANQRILRRLMTNPGRGSLSPGIRRGPRTFRRPGGGRPADPGVIFAQMLLEDSVDQSSTPTVAVTVTVDGYVYVGIQFIYAPTGETSALSFKVTN